MATRYVTLKDSNGDTIYPQSVISQVANGEITANLIDFSTMYVSAGSGHDTQVTSGGVILQSLTLPAGKWRVFASFRFSITSMGNSATKDFYTGFKQGDAISDTTLIEIRTNISSDASGVGRSMVMFQSNEITSTGSYVISSYISYPGTGSAYVYSGPGIYLWAIRVG